MEATVGNCLLYDCQAWVCWKVDLGKLQRWVYKCYRYIWSSGNRERKLAGHENMEDVKWKVEKRVLERIEHVFRMGNEILTKAVVLGWWEELEKWEKRPRKKRMTILY